MMSMTLLVVGCGLALFILVGLIVGVILIMKSGQQDAVGNARQGWMDSGTEQDRDV